MATRIIFIVIALAVARKEGPCEILDRIAVTVAKHVITEGDVARDIRVSAFLDQKPVDLSGAEKRKIADRLVNQLLILQELAFSRIRLDPDEETAKMLANTKLDYGSDGDYRAALARYRVTEADVVNHLLDGVRTQRFTDLRFRPGVEISEEDLHDSYNKLIADARGKGATNIPPFESSRDDLEKLVTLQRVAQALDRWLGEQRTQTQILYHDHVFK